jgi:hypothetical protein
VSASILEMIMLLCFGASWPVSIHKTYTSRTAKGKSAIFLILLEVGYLCGIVNKLVFGPQNYVVFFYVLNLVLVFVDLMLHLRNRKLDREREEGKA